MNITSVMLKKTKPMKENVDFDVRGYSVATGTMLIGILSFSKKIWVLVARLVTRNFTRGLGYAKPPLPVAHAFADARLRRRTPPQAQAFEDANQDSWFLKRKVYDTNRNVAKHGDFWGALSPPSGIWIIGKAVCDYCPPAEPSRVN